ncbi:hypothetical protein [Pseudomonas sp.]|jgi:hypothetical protein|uniref:hypothetical protein n=1 Tax=Pseudomonas sp. TaxID=306 RepID=UPI0037CB8C9B
MRINLVLAVVAIVSLPAAWAQPSTTPAADAPGRATPQPYAPVAPIHLPAPRDGNPPLLTVPAAPAVNPPRRDQELPLLREQRQRPIAPVPAPQY